MDSAWFGRARQRLAVMGVGSMCGGLLLLGLSGALASSALGAIAVSKDSHHFGPGFQYIALPGEQNDVVMVSGDPGPYIPARAESVAVIDRGAGVEVTADGCLSLTKGALCTAALIAPEGSEIPQPDTRGWSYARVILGGGDDRLRLRGLGLRTGMDVDGGTGDDTIDTRNENYEAVDCGDGEDTAYLNQGDATIRCEHVVISRCVGLCAEDIPALLSSPTDLARRRTSAPGRRP